MKILWHGVPAEFATGYGTQTKLFTRALKAQGHDVVVSSIVNSACTYHDPNDILVVSNGSQSRMGNAMIAEHVKRLKPDVLLTMFDTFVMDARQYAGAPLVSWQVVDSAPLHPKLVKAAKIPAVRWSMSRFGERTLAGAGYSSEYVPLALDAKEYNYDDKAKARTQLAKVWNRQVPKFMCVMVAANMSNPSRKNFHGAFKAWRQFLDVNKIRRADALLYVHTEHTGTMASGENLIQLADMCGLNPDVLMFADQYRYNQGRYSPDYLRTVYAAADVLLCSSLGEGFGLPLIEAQACGCPIIAPDATSTAELVGTHGTRIVTGMPVALWGASEMFMPSVDAMVHALEFYRTNPTHDKARRTLSANTLVSYEINNVMSKHLVPALGRAVAVLKAQAEPNQKKGKGNT